MVATTTDRRQPDDAGDICHRSVVAMTADRVKTTIRRNGDHMGCTTSGDSCCDGDFSI
jgi:hypothetical protein